MERSEKTEISLSVIAAMFGAIIWIVILGVILKSWIVTTLPVIMGLVCVLAVIKLYNILPHMKSSIIGTALL